MRYVFWILVLMGLLAGTGCGSAPVLPTDTPPPPSATAVIGISLATRAAPTTAVIQTTPTPLPTPTVTPTATPIIYTIVDGDTLLGIAIQNQTTTEEITALNPDVRPELLQIGQTLILPPPATPAVAGIASTAVPIQIEVRHAAAYQTPVGSVWLLGEVTNQGQLAAANVRLAISLLDGAGHELGTAAAWAAAPVLLPGQSAPFGVLVKEMPAGFVRPAVTVAGGETVVDLGTQYLDLVVAETAVTPADDQIEVAGQVQNSGQSTAQAITITATFYDNQGNVTGYQQHQLQAPLAPAETAVFTFTAAPPGGPAATVSLTAQAQISTN